MSLSSTPADSLWSDHSEVALQKCILPLSPDSYKGSSGRIGVIGGSPRYTGAPYYASMACLTVGADLAFCFCAEEAAIPIKSYSPELMVAPVYQAKAFDALTSTGVLSGQDHPEAEALVQAMVDQVAELLEKLHCLIVGPGLARCPLVLEAISRIIQRAQAYKTPVVIDADALWMLTLEKYQNLLTNDAPVILTPNAMELKRLKKANFSPPETCIVVEKGRHDRIRTNSSGKERVLVCAEEGGLKRSGGLGDILAGTLGTLVAWNRIMLSQNDGDKQSTDLPLSCWTACCVVKRATRCAFEQHRRSMTAPNVLNELGQVVNDMTC